MSVIRVQKNKNYTCMSNYHLREKGLSLKAKGLMSVMLSLPDDWDYSIAGLVAISKENETAIKSALKELKVFGYVRVTKLPPSKTKSGRIEYIYDILEEPEKQEQDVEKQGIENLPLENLHVENQVQLNTKKQNTKKTNTKDKEKIYKKETKIIIDTCLKNDIEDEKSIDLIEDFLVTMKIKTKKSIEANIAKIAGKDFSIIQKCINLAYERNYKYIPDPEWLKPKYSNNRLPQELRLHGTTTKEGRERFKKMVENNDDRLKKF